MKTTPFAKSLPFRAAVTVVLVEALALAVLGSFYATRFAEQVDMRTAAKIAIPGRLLSAGRLSYDAVTDRQSLEHIVGDEVVEAMVVTLDGYVSHALARHEGRNVRQLPGVEASWFVLGGRERIVQVDEGGEHFLVCVTTLYDHDGVTPRRYALVKTRATYAAREKRSIRSVVFVGSLATVVFTSLVIFFLFRRMVLTRLGGVLEVIRRVEEGDLDARVEGHVDDEIGRLQTGVDSMASTIAQRTRTQQDAQEALRKSEENLEITLTSIGDAVIAADMHGRIQRMNPAAEALTGYPAAEGVGRTLGEVLRLVDAETGEPLPNPAECPERSAPPAEVTDRPLLIARDGTERRIAERAAPILDRRGGMVGVVVIFHDVTREHLLQEELRHSQKLDAIGRLAGGVSHDFNNMLGGIIGFAELLAKSLPAEQERGRRYARRIIEIAQQAADLTQKLLAFSRKGKVRSIPIDCNEVLHEVGGILERTVDRRIRIVERPCAEPAVVLGDPSQLQSALLNLAVNARDAMPEGGELTLAADLVDAAAVPAPEARRAGVPPTYAALTVSDTGVGMDRQTQERMFEPFFTTKEVGKGTGLGLAAVYGTVKDHHGFIAVESEPGKGSTFRLFFPAEGELPPAPAPSTQAVVPGTGRILLVDDEAMIRDSAATMLTALGYEVILAEDGHSGAEKFREARERGEPVDVVILDLVMPRVDGHHAFHKLREIDPRAKVLIASGFSLGGETQMLLDIGAVDFIQKPYREHQLALAVRKAMAAPAPDGA